MSSDDSTVPSSAVNSDSTSVTTTTTLATTTATNSEIPIIPIKDYIDKPVVNNPSTLLNPIPIPIYSPNTLIPKSIKFLAFLFFITGATASLLTWFYKTIIYKRLLIKVEILTKLHSSEVINQSNLLERIKKLSKATYFSLLSKDVAPLNDDESSEKVEEVEVTKEIIKVVEEDKSLEEVKEVVDEPVKILEPLRLSLKELAEAVSQSPASNTKITPLPGISNHKVDLAKSLTTLNDYILAEKQSSLTSTYRSYGLGSSSSSANTEKPKTVAEAVSSLKTEIRVVKGALLNRRNFTATAQRVEVN